MLDTNASVSVFHCYIAYLSGLEETDHAGTYEHQANAWREPEYSILGTPAIDEIADAQDNSGGEEEDPEALLYLACRLIYATESMSPRLIPL